jgi:ATP adenylyltransferase
MVYVGRPKSQPDDAEPCLFCFLQSGDAQHDREQLILLRGPRAYVVLNRYPYSNGHLMIVPNIHVPSFESLDPETCLDIMLLLQRSLAALRQALKPEGFNVGANLGRVAGAGVPDHVHVHVVPRWLGDNNYVAVLGKTRLIPQLLEETYDLLQHAGLRSDA